MTNENKRLRRCCFTGHRPEKLALSEQEAKALLKKEIVFSIENGFTCFVCGMSRGIDIWAAQIVLDLKKEHSEIKLVCVCPYRGFEKRWALSDRVCYNNILSKSDHVKFMFDTYCIGCFQMRNRFMVDNCSKVIAAYNGSSGGTKHTVDYSRAKGIEIVNILDA